MYLEKNQFKQKILFQGDMSKGVYLGGFRFWISREGVNVEVSYTLKLTIGFGINLQPKRNEVLNLLMIHSG